MELTVDSFIAIASLFLGGSGGAFFTWRWVSRKSKAEAQTAEVNMAKEVQDIYQQALKDKDEELRYYKSDSEEQRRRLDDMDSKMRDLQVQVSRNGRMVEAMRPFMCADLGCKQRKRVMLSPDVAGEDNETKE